jgi:hypothetical protein
MVKMRIPIREQLGCLVLLASMIGLAVIAVATWVPTNAVYSSVPVLTLPAHQPQLRLEYTVNLAISHHRRAVLILRLGRLVSR